MGLQGLDNGNFLGGKGRQRFQDTRTSDEVKEATRKVTAPLQEEWQDWEPYDPFGRELEIEGE